MKIRKKILVGLLISATLITNMATTLLATEEVDLSADASQEKVLTPEEAMAVAYAAPVDSNALKNWPQGPVIGGEAGIVMDMNSGAILYAKGIDDQHFPASITKVLTALIALENSELTDKVTFTEDSISFLEYGDAQIGMKPGEELSMEDALYAVLLASANEVSHAVAECAVPGGYNEFLEKMNAKAKELGGKNSNFANPHGLHLDNHYTTARDMALISSEAFKIPEFRTITNTYEHTIGATNLVAESRIFQQNHKMLYDGHVNFYEYCVGGKTGYTDQALTTLITFADNGVMQLVAVNLKTHGPKVYEDTRGMLDYVFGNFAKVSIADNVKSEDVKEVMDKEAYVVLPSNMTLDQLDEKVTCSGTKEANVGTVSYSYGNQFLGAAKIEASATYFEKLQVNADAMKKQNNKNEKKTDSEQQSTWPKGFKILVGILIITGIILVAIEIRKAKIRANRKQKRNRQRRKR